jgi:hypothetical protein
MVAIAGCGSDSKTSPPATSPAAGSSEPASVDTDAPASNGGGGGAASVQLPVQEGNYTSGRVHVEFGGDSGGAVEIDGTGFITGGYGNIVFADAERAASVTFGFGGDQGSIAAFTWDGITSGGEFGKECTVNFTKGDQSTLAADFTCVGMAGVTSSATATPKVDARGSFTLTA